jgi:hypothetical protein
LPVGGPAAGCGISTSSPSGLLRGRRGAIAAGATRRATTPMGMRRRRNGPHTIAGADAFGTTGAAAGGVRRAAAVMEGIAAADWLNVRRPLGAPRENGRTAPGAGAVRRAVETPATVTVSVSHVPVTERIVKR